MSLQFWNRPAPLGNSSQLHCKYLRTSKPSTHISTPINRKPFNGRFKPTPLNIRWEKAKSLFPKWKMLCKAFFCRWWLNRFPQTRTLKSRYVWTIVHLQQITKNNQRRLCLLLWLCHPLTATIIFSIKVSVLRPILPDLDSSLRSPSLTGADGNSG